MCLVVLLSLLVMLLSLSSLGDGFYKQTNNIDPVLRTKLFLFTSACPHSCLRKKLFRKLMLRASLSNLFHHVKLVFHLQSTSYIA